MDRPHQGLDHRVERTSGIDSVLEDGEHESPKPTEKLPMWPLCTFLLLYCISFAMAMPAFPISLLKATGEKTDVSSAYYGVATSLRFFIEFFAAPILGAISDARGRRAVFIVSLGTVTVEFFLLAAWPSITSVFISRILSGCLDATIPMSYAGMIDLAKRNEENVTDQFGKLGAVFGTGVIIGPLLGSII